MNTLVGYDLVAVSRTLTFYTDMELFVRILPVPDTAKLENKRSRCILYMYRFTPPVEPPNRPSRQDFKDTALARQGRIQTTLTNDPFGHGYHASSVFN